VGTQSAPLKRQNAQHGDACLVIQLTYFCFVRRDALLKNLGVAETIQDDSLILAAHNETFEVSFRRRMLYVRSAAGWHLPDASYRRLHFASLLYAGKMAKCFTLKMAMMTRNPGLAPWPSVKTSIFVGEFRMWELKEADYRH
jgi:hypothetical protein